MMGNFTGNIKRMMGWCPQEKTYRTEDKFILDHTYCSKAHTDNGSIHEDMDVDMDVPLQMFDWRIWAIVLGFAGLIIIGSAWADTYRYFIPVSSILIALLIVFFHTSAYRIIRI